MVLRRMSDAAVKCGGGDGEAARVGLVDTIRVPRQLSELKVPCIHVYTRATDSDKYVQLTRTHERGRERERETERERQRERETERERERREFRESGRRTAWP